MIQRLCSWGMACFIKHPPCQGGKWAATVNTDAGREEQSEPCGSALYLRKSVSPNWRWAQPTYLAREAAKSKLPQCSVHRAAFPLNSLKWKAFAFIFKTLHVLAKRCLGERLSVSNKNLLRMRSLLCLLQGWCHSNSSRNLKMTAGEEGGCICFGKRGFIYFFSGKTHFGPGRMSKMTICLGALKLLSTTFSAYMLSHCQQRVCRGSAEENKLMYAVLKTILLRASAFFLLTNS